MVFASVLLPLGANSVTIYVDHITLFLLNCQHPKEEFSVKANQTIRKAARAAGIPFWKIAVRLGVCEQTLIRWLRVPLDPEKEQDILAVIDELAKEAV